MKASEFEDAIRHVLAEAYDTGGITANDLATQVGCSRNRIYQWLKSHEGLVVEVGRTATAGRLLALDPRRPRVRASHKQRHGGDRSAIEFTYQPIITSTIHTTGGSWHITAQLQITEGLVLFFEDEATGERIAALTGERVRELVATAVK